MSNGSSATTRGVRIDVRPEYLEDRSSPQDHVWMHAYHVVITNVGEEPVQLLHRHWIITNMKGVEEHVRGPGVVGEQPLLDPGQRFRYTSGCPLDTPMGTMHGHYVMKTPGGDTFEAEVAPFTLAEPFALN